MAVLRVDHPDIEEFIDAKHNQTSLTTFNISVGVTDEFMQAVLDDRMFELRFEGQAYGEVRAKHLWERIMRSTWDWGEPGVIFLDTINRLNNLILPSSFSGAPHYPPHNHPISKYLSRSPNHNISTKPLKGAIQIFGADKIIP